ncbi:MAG: MFS transporter [Gammaproteobacteria bacterium]|nr:MFS transporter [Gammaproteobacteria bacterium]
MIILCLITGLATVGFGLVLPTFLFYAENLGATPMVATIIIGTYSMGQFIGTPIWGRVSDRIGRKPVLLISIFGQGICFVLLALSTNLWMLALARFFGGMVSANISTAMAYVTDSTEESVRAKHIGFIGASVSVGFMAGPALGGLLGGQDASTASLYLPAMVAGSISFTTGICALFFLKESLKKENRSDKTIESNSLIKNWGLVFRRPILPLIILLGLGMMYVTGTFETIFPLWTNARFSWSPMDIGFCLTYIGLVVTLMQATVVGRVVPILGEARVIRISFFGYALGLLIMSQAPNWEIMIAGLTVSAASGAAFSTSASSLVSKVAGKKEKGFVLGVYQSGCWLGRILGPLTAGALFSLIDVNAPLYAGIVILIPCIIVVGFISKKMKQQALHSSI